MAHKQEVGNNAIKDHMFGANFFWNISDNVGYGYKNNESDVLLVQFFLNSTVRAFNKYSEGKDVSTIVPDGKFGGQTWAKVKWFQTQVECVVDGMVSSPSGNSLFTPNQGQIYTMYTFNAVYKRCFGHYYPDIRVDPKCPVPLRGHFTVPHDIFD